MVVKKRKKMHAHTRKGIQELLLLLPRSLGRCEDKAVV